MNPLDIITGLMHAIGEPQLHMQAIDLGCHWSLAAFWAAVRRHKVHNRKRESERERDTHNEGLMNDIQKGHLVRAVKEHQMCGLLISNQCAAFQEVMTRLDILALTYSGPKS